MNVQSVLKKIIIFFIIFSFILISKNVYPKLSDIFKSSKGELKITAVSPKGSTEGVRESDAVTVTFSDAVVSLSKLGKPIIDGPIKLVPPLKGKFKWLGTKTLAFYADKPFPKNTKIIAIIKKGLKSITGKKLKKDYKWNFRTKQPKLKKSDPYNKRKWISLDSLIFIYFDMPMKKSTAGKYITITENGVKQDFKIRYIKTNELNKWERRRFDKKTALVRILSKFHGK